MDRIIETYEFKKPKENNEAENRTDTLCIPYVKGASDRLWKQRAKEAVIMNMIFKRGKTLGRYLINGGPPKSNRKKNIIYKIPCTRCNCCYIGETTQWFDEEKNNTNTASRIVTQIMEYISI